MWEQIAFAVSLAQSHTFAELRAGVRAIGERFRIPYSGVKAQDIRKVVTGKGNASKEQVWAELARRGHRCMVDIKGEAVPDYDASDALALLFWRLEMAT